MKLEPSGFLHRLPPGPFGAIAALMAFATAALCISLFYMMAAEKYRASLGERVRDLASLAASTVDIELHQQIRKPEQAGSDIHQQALQPLVAFHRSIPEIHYLYTMIYDGDREFFILDSAQDPIIGGQPDIVPSAIMEEFLTDHPKDAAARQTLEAGNTFLFKEPYEDTFGRFISAMAPLFDAEGNLEGFVGVDYRISEYDRSIAQMRGMAAGAMLIGLICSVFLGMLARSLRLQSLRQVEERARAESAARVAKEKAEAALAAKQDLLSIAAHDLKNPLAAIVGVADITGQSLDSVPPRYLSETTRRLFDRIPRYADNMLRIIEEVLKAETIDRIGSQVDNKPFNASEVAAETVDFNRFPAKKKNITIHYVCERAYMMTGDRDRIMEALDNLISNAVKYSPPGSRVDVALGCDLAQSKLRFSVTDDGPGLSDEDQAALFQKFHKLSAKPTGGETSSGLGLSIVKHVVEAHGGTVACESEPGFGATFYIELPIVDAKPLHEDDDGPSGTQHPFQSGKALLAGR